jgi:hypothetical protein
MGGMEAREAWEAMGRRGRRVAGVHRGEKSVPPGGVSYVGCPEEEKTPLPTTTASRKPTRDDEAGSFTASRVVHDPHEPPVRGLCCSSHFPDNVALMITDDECWVASSNIRVSAMRYIARERKTVRSKWILSVVRSWLEMDCEWLSNRGQYLVPAGFSSASHGPSGDLASCQFCHSDGGQCTFLDPPGAESCSEVGSDWN